MDRFFRAMSAYVFVYFIQHCFICHPSDSTVLEDAGIELRTVARFAFVVTRFNYPVILSAGSWFRLKYF
jgi:hypothetical protein